MFKIKITRLQHYSVYTYSTLYYIKTFDHNILNMPKYIYLFFYIFNHIVIRTYLFLKLIFNYSIWYCFWGETKMIVNKQMQRY